MSSTTKKRRKSKHTSNSPSPSFLKEPPSSLFPSKQEFFQLVAVVAVASFVAVACNYTVTIVNRKPKPFCDTDAISQDFCEPCPKNGECFEGDWQCLPGYKKYGRFCIEDGEINQAAKELSDCVEHQVCEAHAQFLCDGTGRIWFQEDEILKMIDEHDLKEKGSKNDTFTYAKGKAMESIASSLEKRLDIDGVKELKCPDLLANHYRPPICCIRQWSYRNAIYVLPAFVLFLGLIKMLWRVRRSRYLSARAEELYEQVCEILEENATSFVSMKSEGVPWVVASWLRDHLLLPRERKDPVLWTMVSLFS